MERMEQMSKKPFNPVLGEELNAWTEHAVHGPTLLKAEQVSHHPPVSALVMGNAATETVIIIIFLFFVRLYSFISIFIPLFVGTYFQH